MSRFFMSSLMLVIFTSGSTYKIFDFVGRVILSGTDEDEQVIIDGSKGIYVLQISTQNKLINKKVVKLK